MSKFFQCLRNILERFDLFPSNQFLRYKQNVQFKTAFGGFISLNIIVIFIILFSNLGVKTINQQIINGSVSYQIQAQPETLTVEFANGSDIMFAVAIGGLNLNDPNVTYFNFTITQSFYSLLQVINTTTIPLVQCTPQHFSYNTDTQNFYTQFSFNHALCPPLNYEFIVGGRIASQIYSQLSIKISECNNAVNSKCVTNSQLTNIQNQLGGFTLIVPIISTIVNPGDSAYKQVYIEDRNYYFFTTTTGIWLYGQFQQYRIDTDVSLMPYTNIQSQYITAIPNLLNLKPQQVFNEVYGQIIFSKSSTSTIFTRSFNKIDSYLSYVGGLIGTVLLIFFILNAYSQSSYIISIASQIYTLQENKSSPLKNFNFLYYIAMNIKEFFSLIRFQFSWQQPDKFIKALDEMGKQLDIAYLLKRINYLEEAITSILPQHQIDTLYLNDKKSIQAAATLRKKSNMPKGIATTILKQGCGEQNLSLSKNGYNYTLQQNDISKRIFVPMEIRPQQQVNLEQIDEQNNTENQGSSQKIQIVNHAKQSLIQVIHESNQGDPISRRIISKVNKRVFPQINLLLYDSNPKKDQKENQKQEMKIEKEKEKEKEQKQEKKEEGKKDEYNQQIVVYEQNALNEKQSQNLDHFHFEDIG